MANRICQKSFRLKLSRNTSFGARGQASAVVDKTEDVIYGHILQEVHHGVRVYMWADGAETDQHFTEGILRSENAVISLLPHGPTYI